MAQFAAVICLTLVHLGCHVRICPYHVGAIIYLGNLGNTEVAELKAAVLADENVLRLDITVNDIVLTAKLKRAARFSFSTSESFSNETDASKLPAEGNAICP